MLHAQYGAYMRQLWEYERDEIERAIEEMKKARPDFINMIDLYAGIMLNKAGANFEKVLHSNLIDKETLNDKLERGEPVHKISEFKIDIESSRKLFLEICRIVIGSGTEGDESIEGLRQAVEYGKFDISDLYKVFLEEDEEQFESISVAIGIDKEILAFIVFNSLKPSINLFAEWTAGQIEDIHKNDYDRCPICGSPPALSLLGDNGKRFLECGFCSYIWQTKRIYCPYCGNEDHESLKYYSIENEDLYRVDVCERCEKFIKTIDTRNLSRTIYTPLENLCTHHLNIKFEQMGYKTGVMRA